MQPSSCRSGRLFVVLAGHYIGLTEAGQTQAGHGRNDLLG